MDLSRLRMSISSNIKLTNKQQTVVDSTEPAILVNAVAGSGKTSTLMALAAKHGNGLYLAFNKAIVTDVIAKLPVGWSCKTFNSFGLGITKEHYPTAKVNFKKYQKKSYSAAATLANHHMCMNGNVSEVSWGMTADHFRISRQFINEAQDILTKGKAKTDEISGEDMLQYPIDRGWKSKHYDVVLVDECQDLNPQQIAFLSCIPTDRIVFVGDRNQAIYGFRGSDPYAIEKLKDAYNPIEIEMSESFRCPTAVVDVISGIVPSMMTRKQGGQVSRVRINDVVFDEDCFIISRTNSSLIKLAYTFLKSGEDFSIGSAFIRQLNFDLTPFMKKANSLSELASAVDYKYRQELSKAQKNRWSSAAIQSKYDGIVALIEAANSMAEVKEFITSLALHSDGSSTRRLMTIHAAKGLENDHVYFLNPEACEYFKNQTDIGWRKQEEDNLYYVACTRTLSKLTFVKG